MQGCNSPAVSQPEVHNNGTAPSCDLSYPHCVDPKTWPESSRMCCSAPCEVLAGVEYLALVDPFNGRFGGVVLSGTQDAS